MSASRTRTDGTTVSPAPITYGQLGVLLELLWRGEKTAFVKCDFCQTLNHRFATRCEACSGKLSAASQESRGLVQDVSAQAARPERGAMQRRRRELANLMLWVLGMPVLLFLIFIGWQQSHTYAARISMAAPAVTEAEAGTVAANPASAAASAGLAAGTAPASSAMAAASLLTQPLSPLQQQPQPALAPLPPAVASVQPESESLARQAPEVEARPAGPARNVARARLAAVNPRAQADPTADCEGRMFLLRAICVNRRCAEPQNAGCGHCVEVVRQRRIDEARRNPTLVG